MVRAVRWSGAASAKVCRCDRLVLAFLCGAEWPCGMTFVLPFCIQGRPDVLLFQQLADPVAETGPLVRSRDIA